MFMNKLKWTLFPIVISAVLDVYPPPPPARSVVVG